MFLLGAKRVQRCPLPRGKEACYNRGHKRASPHGKGEEPVISEWFTQTVKQHQGKMWLLLLPWFILLLAVGTALIP